MALLQLSPSSHSHSSSRSRGGEEGVDDDGKWGTPRPGTWPKFDQSCRVIKVCLAQNSEVGAGEAGE